MLWVALCLVVVRGGQASGAGAKSPAEWLAECRGQTKSELADPKFQKPWRGAAIYIHGHYRRGFFDGDNLFGRKLTQKEEELVSGFANFLQNRGQRLYELWLLEQTLPGEDQKYKYIFNGLCFSEYFKQLRPKVTLKMELTPLEQRCWDYSQGVMRSGAVVLRKAYRAQRLDASELDQDLRSSAFICGSNLVTLPRGTRLPYCKPCCAHSPGFSSYSASAAYQRPMARAVPGRRCSSFSWPCSLTRTSRRARFGR